MDAPRTAGRPSVIAMEALDGNAIAGSLFEYFGSDMTSVRGRCMHCGTVAPIAELAVYTRHPAPSHVAGPAETWRWCSWTPEAQWSSTPARSNCPSRLSAVRAAHANRHSTHRREAILDAAESDCLHRGPFLGRHPKCR